MHFNKENYLTISQFGKLCGIDRKTLIFYDKEEVFSPIYKDEKGYRYYSIKQYDTLSIILDLRNIGVSLSFIKKYLNNRNPEKCIDLLEEENKSIKKQIRKLSYISKTIESKVDLTRKGILEGEKLDVHIEKKEEEFLAYKEIKAFDDENINKDFLAFINYCIDNEINYGYSIGAIISLENINSNKFDEIDKLFVYVSEDKAKALGNYILKPRGLYATINYKGDYINSWKSYNKLLCYLKINGYKVCSDSYEYGLLDYFSSNNENEYLTNISIRIESI